MPSVAQAQQLLTLRVDDLAAGPQRGVVIRRQALRLAVVPGLMLEARPQRDQRRARQLTIGGELVEPGQARPDGRVPRLPAQRRLVSAIGLCFPSLSRQTPPLGLTHRHLHRAQLPPLSRRPFPAGK